MMLHADHSFKRKEILVYTRILKLYMHTEVKENWLDL